MVELVAVAFFCISMAYSIGWIAVSSMLAAYKTLFGPAVLLRLNLAYYLPSIPVLLAGARYDSKFNRRVGLGAATIFRMSVGLGGSAIVCGLLPFLMWNERQLNICVALLGVTSGIAFGSSYALVSHFPTSSNIALTAGFVGGGPLILALELAGGIGPHATLWKAALVYEFAAVLTTLGLVSALMLVVSHWHHLRDNSGTVDFDERLLPSLLRSPALRLMSHSSQPSSKEDTPPSSPSSTHQHSLSLEGPVSLQSSADEVMTPPSSPSSSRLPADAFLPSSELLARPQPSSPANSLRATFRATWPAAAALFMSVAAAMLVSPFFTFVPSSGWLADMLPQALFASRTLSDVGGRFIPFAPCMRSKAGLFIAGMVRLATTPSFFWYTKAAGAYGMLNDAVAVLAVAFFWASSGHVNACAYVMAAAWAPPGAKERAGGLMALVFQMACLLSLLCAAAVQHYSFQTSS